MFYFRRTLFAPLTSILLELHSPIEFSRCHDFGTPERTAKLSVDVAKIDSVYQNGWTAKDSYVLAMTSDSAGNPVSSGPNSVSGLYYKGYFTDNYFMGVDSICLAPGEVFMHRSL